MNGIHEVVGSIPISSTNDHKRLGRQGLPDFLFFRLFRYNPLDPLKFI